MILRLPTEHLLEFLRLQEGYTGSPELTHVKMPHCCGSNKIFSRDEVKYQYLKTVKRVALVSATIIMLVYCCASPGTMYLVDNTDVGNNKSPSR